MARAPASDHHAALAGLLKRGPVEAERLAASAPQFARFLGRHRLASVIFEAVPSPSALRDELREQRRLEAARYLSRLAMTSELLSELRRRGVGVVCFKGIGIAHRIGVYTAPELRPVGDTDVLVRPAHLQRAIEACAALGFSPSAPGGGAGAAGHYQVPLIHPRHGLLELHRDLYRDFPEGTLDVMLARTRPIEVYGEPAEILCDADLWLVCAVHLAQNRDLLWIWVVDLYLLGNVMAPAQWQLLADTARSTRTEVFVSAALAAMDAAWGLQPPGMPEELAERMRAALSPLERLALTRLRARLPDGSYDGDQLLLARRLSGRPVRGEHGVLTSIWPHADAVALASGVPPDDPGFAWERIKLAARRIGRGTAAVGRMLRGRR